MASALRRKDNGLTIRRGGAIGKNKGRDERMELGKQLEPYARFDKDLERFCCRDCGWQGETYRGIEAHLAECTASR